MQNTPEKPLVSVICLCRNHEQFIAEALQSVFGQTYPNIEVIVADDCSTDKSVEAVEKCIADHSGIQFIKNNTNEGNCKTFNKAFQRSKGKYIIDFATDDVMLPERITEQVNQFEALDESFGVVFSDAFIIDEDSQQLRTFYKRNKNGALQEAVPSGDIYQAILERSFICPPTVMIRRQVLEQLGGYDEQLAYEDFDFWVRSSRSFNYFFSEKVLTKKRITSGSLSSGFYKRKKDALHRSTLKVCEKAFALNQNTEENKALGQRIFLQMRGAYFTENFETAREYFQLYKKISKPGFGVLFFNFLAKIRLPLHFLYAFYLRMRFGK